MTQTVVWEPLPGPQTALLTCPCFEVFFGGARGGGKTDGMLGEFASHAAQYGEHAIGLMIRRKRTELLETIERSRQIYGPLGAKYNTTDAVWRFPNGARIRFAYLEQDSDADAYQGHNYTRVYVEEAGTFPSADPILKLMATLRSGTGVPVGIRLTGNPGGPGQQWVKARYVDPQPKGMQIFKRRFKSPFTGATVERDWVYIPSRLSDNPKLGDDYVANLHMVGSAALVKAWLTGDFSIVEGAFFDNWDNEKHVIKEIEIPDHWLKFRSMDWGSAAPFSVGWWAVVGDRTRVQPGLHSGRGGFTLPRGSLVRFREWYGAKAPGKGLKLTAEQVADGILEREADDYISYGVLDPSAFAEDGGPSIAERMANKGVYFHRADNKRVSRRGAMGGWDQMRYRLTSGTICCFDTCTDSIRTIPALQHDRDKTEDLDTEAEDHAADEWRYACMSRPHTLEIDKEDLAPDTGYERHKMRQSPDDWVCY